tara:strand:+ start:774 stop:1487 length:714 start_codon:yes stop_codon:yes gene_type:complete
MSNIVEIPCDIYEYVLDYLPILDVLSGVVAMRGTSLEELEYDCVFWDKSLIKHTCFMGMRTHPDLRHNDPAHKLVLGCDPNANEIKKYDQCCPDCIEKSVKMQEKRKIVLKKYYYNQENLYVVKEQKRFISKQILTRLCLVPVVECPEVIHRETLRRYDAHAYEEEDTPREEIDEDTPRAALVELITDLEDEVEFLRRNYCARQPNLLAYISELEDDLENSQDECDELKKRLCELDV